MPVFASDILHGGPRTLGFLMAASGVGALAGAICLAARKTVLGLGRWIAAAGLAFGVCLMLFAISRSLWASCPLAAGAGFCMIVQMASSNTVLQTIVEDNIRGRVMSLFTMAFMGTMPIGSLLAGELARPERLGPSRTGFAGGVCCVAAALLFARKLPRIREHVRPIYVRRGVLPAEVASGLAAATELRSPKAAD